MTAPLSAGLGLKPVHGEAAFACSLPGLWFEVHAENCMVPGGPRLRWLDEVRAVHPLSLHGVALSLAGAEPLDVVHLGRLAALVRRLEPALVSEHLAWTASGGRYFPDLLPFARTGKALRRIAARIEQAQSVLGRRLAIENPSHYLRMDHDWDEVDFLAELATRTGCGLLLDVNNVYVSARNLGFEAAAWLDRFPGDAVVEIHLAGHSSDPTLGPALLVDSHDAPVAPPVWALYRRLLARIGPRPTLIERDGNIPPFGELLAERAVADDAWQQANEPSAVAA